LIVLSQKYSQLCTAAGLEQQAVKKLKQVKIIAALSKKALKNIAASSTPDTSLPDDLVKLLRKLLLIEEDYDRILPLVEKIYEVNVVKPSKSKEPLEQRKAKLAKEVLIELLNKKREQFEVNGFHTLFVKRWKEALQTTSEVTMPGTELNFNYDQPLGKNKKLEGKINFIPKGVAPAFITLETGEQQTPKVAAEFIKNELALLGKKFTTSLLNLELKKDIFFGKDLPELDFGIEPTFGQIEVDKKLENFSINLMVWTIRLKLKFPSSKALVGPFAILKPFYPIFDFDIEIAISYEVPATVSLSK